MRLTDSEAFELLLVNYMNNPCISEESKYLLSVVLDMAKANPTIEGVPVVRCKDCVYAKPFNEKWSNLLWCDILKTYKEKDWFCADAERREDNG